MLEPFKIDVSCLGDEELMILNIESPGLTVSHAHGLNQRLALQVHLVQLTSNMSSQYLTSICLNVLNSCFDQRLTDTTLFDDR